MNQVPQPVRRRNTTTGIAASDASTTGRATTAAHKHWTGEQIRALGAATNLTTAAEIFGLSRDTAYQLARTGQFPVPVLRVGRQLRVPIAPILALLGLPVETPDPASRLYSATRQTLPTRDRASPLAY
jgi:hypothetical protein